MEVQTVNAYTCNDYFHAFIFRSIFRNRIFAKYVITYDLDYGNHLSNYRYFYRR